MSKFLLLKAYDKKPGHWKRQQSRTLKVGLLKSDFFSYRAGTEKYIALAIVLNTIIIIIAVYKKIKLLLFA